MKAGGTLLTILILSFQSFSQEALRNIRLEEVIISASKVPENKDKIAQPIEMITPIQIRQINASTTAELISSSGNLNIQKSQQGGGSPVIRGFEASRILLVVDGVRMNNLIYRTGHLQNIITIDPNALEKVELLYGPSSTVYGSDALGGVIHMVTKTPQLSRQNDVLEITGNANLRFATAASEKSANITMNLATKRIASFTSLTYSNFGDLKMGKSKNPFYNESFGERLLYVKRIHEADSLVENSNRYLQKFSGYTQTDILEKILIQSGPNSTHNVNIQYSNSSDIPRYDRLTDPAGPGLKYAEWYYGPQHRLLIAYDYKLKYMLGLDHIRIGGNFQNIAESRFTRRFGNNNLDVREEKVHVFGLNLDALKSWSRNEMRFGAEAQFNSLNSSAYNRDIVTNIHGPLDSRYPDGENVMNSFAAYYSHKLTLHEKWTLNDGVRLGYSYLHSTFIDTSFYQFPYSSITQKNTVLSGAAGLVFMPDILWRFALNLSSGFRVPNVDDLAKVFESAPGLVVVPNPDLLPERSYNADLSMDYKFAAFIKWENSFFVTSFRNIITTDDFSWNGQDSILYDGEMSKVVANQNKQKAWITGFSSTLLAEPLPWYYGVAITYTYGRVLENGAYGPLDHIPPFFGKLYIGFRKEKWDAQLFTLFNGWKPLKNYRLGAEDNEAYATEKGTPAWFTLNLRCSYNISRYLSAQVGIDNMMDFQYRTFSSGINAPGRNFIVSLRGTL